MQFKISCLTVFCLLFSIIPTSVGQTSKKVFPDPTVDYGCNADVWKSCTSNYIDWCGIAFDPCQCRWLFLNCLRETSETVVEGQGTPSTCNETALNFDCSFYCGGTVCCNIDKYSFEQCEVYHNKLIPYLDYGDTTYSYYDDDDFPVADESSDSDDSFKKFSLAVHIIALIFICFCCFSMIAFGVYYFIKHKSAA